MSKEKRNRRSKMTGLLGNKVNKLASNIYFFDLGGVMSFYFRVLADDIIQSNRESFNIMANDYIVFFLFQDHPT